MKVRDNRWDFYKGLLIFGVILGHVITAYKCGSEVSSWLAVFLRTYDMPFFAFVTGFFLNKSCQKRKAHLNVLNKITSILFPIILWTIIFNFINLQFSFHLGRFWFLWSIWCVSVIIIVIDSLTSNNIIKLILFFLVTLVLHTLIKGSYNLGFLFVPCAFGYYFSDITTLIKNKRFNILYLKIIIILLFIVLYSFWKTDYNVWKTGCDIFAFGTPFKTAMIILYRTCLGLTGCLTMKWLFDEVFRLLSNSQYVQLNKVSNAFVHIGRSTLELYILQTFFVENIGARVLKKIIEFISFNPFVIHINLLNLLIAPATTLIAIIVMYYFQKYIKKIPFIGNYIFGFSNLKLTIKNKG